MSAPDRGKAPAEAPARPRERVRREDRGGEVILDEPVTVEEQPKGKHVRNGRRRNTMATRTKAKGKSAFKDLRSGPWVIDHERLTRALVTALDEAREGHLTLEGLIARVERADAGVVVRPEAVPSLAKALRAEGWRPRKRVVTRRG